MNNLRNILIIKFTTVIIKNKWQIEYRNICQGLTETMDTYVACFKKVINKAEMVNLLFAQMQVMDFIAGLRSELVIIVNKANLTDHDEAKKTVKNVKNVSFINKNVLIVITILAVTDIKELKAQILKLKVELKEFKYILREDRKLLLNIERNKKPLYKEPNYKPVDKRNLEYYKCSKKDYFKSKYQSKLKDRIDYQNIHFLEII